MSKRSKTDWPGEPICQNVQKLIGQENPCVKTFKNKLVRRTQVSNRSKTDRPGEPMCQNVQKRIGQENPNVKPFKN